MTTTFDDIVGNLTPSNFDTLRGYILDCVRAEFGPLIQSLENQGERTEIRADEDQYSEGTGEPVTTENEETRDQFTPISFGSFLRDIGITVDKADRHDQHLRFHALQNALAYCHETDKDPMVHANLFYGFLKGDA